MTASVFRVLAVLNPSASRAGAAMEGLRDWFGEGARATVVTTSSRDELHAVLRKHGPSADRIIVGGGDGTISGALPALLELKKPVAVLPLGTANDFARTLGLPDNPIDAAAVALRGDQHAIDVGLANGQPFLNVASVGVAADVVRIQSKELKRRWRSASYLIGFAQAAWKARPFYAHVDVDEAHVWSGAVYQVSVGNGRFHGGGLVVAEHAAIDDGQLDIYLVAPGKFWQLVACATHLKFGIANPVLLQKRCASRVQLRTVKRRPVNLDGEIRTTTPVEFTLLPKALTVLAPRHLPVGNRGLSRPTTN